jgi:putative transcriptional regulator
MEVRDVFLARRWLPAAVAAPVVLGLALLAVEPASTQAQYASLPGQLLVATSELESPSFTRTVIYMVRHDAKTGAMGLVVNRQLGEVPIAVLLKQSGLPSAGVKGSLKLHMGGPVEPTSIFVLHTDEYAAPNTVKIANGIALTDDASILQSIAEGKGPRRSRFMLGYAGWAPGQLEAELQAGYWIVVPSDDAILFDDIYDTKWDRAMARRKINL